LRFKLAFCRLIIVNSSLPDDAEPTNHNCVLPSGGIKFPDATLFTSAAVAYTDGGELSLAARELGNTDNFNLSFITNDLHRIHITSGGKVSIGQNVNSATVQLEVIGTAGSNIGGFPSGLMHVTGSGTTVNSNSVITGHSLFNGNTQLWYLGSVSSSNNNIAFINRQNAEIHIHTNDIKQVTVEAAGNMILEKQIRIKGGSPGTDKVLTSDGVGLGTWKTPDTAGFTDDGTTVRLTAFTDKVGIGTSSPDARLEVNGNSAGTVGGFSSGVFHVRSPGTAQFSSVAISGHNTFAGNTQLWFVGSASSGNDEFTIINRQNASLNLNTNNIKRVTIEAAGNVVLEKQILIKGGVPGIGKILTSDANGLATWESPVSHIGGNFVDTTDQTIRAADVSQSITFTKNKLIDDISHTAGDSVFTINTAGHYKISITPQLAQGSGAATVEFWIRKNGTDVTDSNVQLTVAANSEGLPILLWEEEFVATDTFEIIWASNSANTLLDNIASLFSGPNIPSIMLRITHVGN